MARGAITGGVAKKNMKPLNQLSKREDLLQSFDFNFTFFLLLLLCTSTGLITRTCGSFSILFCFLPCGVAKKKREKRKQIGAAENNKLNVHTPLEECSGDLSATAPTSGGA